MSADRIAVIGVHLSGGISTSAGRRINGALALDEVLDELLSSDQGREIARHHRLANIDAAHRRLASVATSESGVPDSDPALLAAALAWSVDPDDLGEAVRNRVRQLVGDPDEPRWSLLADERRRLIVEAGTLRKLRRAYTGLGDDGPGQRTIDRILSGPPFDLAKVPQEQLPYWLQAVRWFSGVVPELPTPAEVQRTLERQRVRQVLVTMAGPRLWGRKEELARLREWYLETTSGPVAVTGIGGVGKSALIASFALDLPVQTVLLWLDFDRADLAPDDAVSVLGSIARQMAAQLDDFTPPLIDGSTWERGADVLGATLARTVSTHGTPLLVLDGFEIAQHIKRHEEIWGVLDRILLRAPALRVIVSGRAPVPTLKLRGRPGIRLHLEGLTPDAAIGWLHNRHVTDKAVLSAVLRVSQCVPLQLKMAVRLLETGGDLNTVPDDLPRALIEGYLYQRILDRVVEPTLRPLARDVLVLRRLSVEMLTNVLGDRVPPDMDPLQVFALLSRELALVEVGDAAPAADSQGQLWLRPEVRVATLRLLESDDAERVREIDRRAAAWYAKQHPRDAKVAGELVYHRLRLGRITKAERAWRDDCAPLLLNAEDEIPAQHKRARAWLRKRITGTDYPAVSVAIWEDDAYQRVRAALSRGLYRVVPAILNEQLDRTPASPLLAFDAWVLWQMNHDLPGARALLATAAAVPTPTAIQRDRTVLAALLAAEDGDQSTADNLLAPLDDPFRWEDRKEGGIEALALRAARVRLAVDLPLELELAEVLEGPHKAMAQFARTFLGAADLVMPSLQRRLADEPGMESYRMPTKIPDRLEQLETFARELEVNWRRHSLRIGSPEINQVRHLLDSHISNDMELNASARALSFLRVASDLAELAQRRWHIATRTMFLRDVHRACHSATADALMLSVVSTLAVFRGLPLTFTDGDTVDDVILRSVGHAGSVGTTNLSHFGEKLLQHELRESRHRSSWMTLGSAISELERSVHAVGDVAFWASGVPSLFLYVSGPAPLKILQRRLLGIPDTAREEAQ